MSSIDQTTQAIAPSLNQNQANISQQIIKAEVIVVGAGPAGLMAAYLLARQGRQVVLLEKHSDFLRDFRGDTIHPSTLDLIDQLGFLDEFLKISHTRAEKLNAEINGKDITIADFSKLSTKCKFIAFMPQWEFLNFLCDKAKQFDNFSIIMDCQSHKLLYEHDKVVGVEATTSQGDIHVEAPLTIAADGRNSILRQQSSLDLEEFGVASNVLWMKLSHQKEDPPYTMGHGGPRQGFILIDRGDYWQCGFVIPKGSFEELKAKGLENFREEVARFSPLPASRMDEITSWDAVHLLSIRINRLKQWWQPGLLFIGDAAHAMSPIGGVGVNLAIQDAVAATNILNAPLRNKNVSTKDLAKVQKRRSFPTKATQRLQLMMQKSSQKRNLDPEKKKAPPSFMRYIAKWPPLAHFAGRIVGMGFRSEKIKF
ncbi:FAD-dependent oxidoreductase [Bartonella sp. HY761]|uniref:FAD-dependent oxidoreductase n=1 Tax=Bartonella sp. HY761 TaxID=2979330 RepID=UPI00220E6C24|nr:FAD-dependent oxidoreductase [Bartonella sp. HY761]UXN05760.1 FAD-dependent oxidoreductase [Bartonella sp. HY761]